MIEMIEMVERVARVLCARTGVDPDDATGGTWDGGSYPCGEPAWMSWQDDACVVLQSMANFPDEMFNRFYKIMEKENLQWENINAGIVWQLIFQGFDVRP